MGSTLGLAFALTVTAYAHAAPAEPESPKQFELAPRPAPLPPYGGANWSSTCPVQLEPAASAEQSARVVAMRTWLPGAKITLAPLGDRARSIDLPTRARRPEDAERRLHAPRRARGRDETSIAFTPTITSHHVEQFHPDPVVGLNPLDAQARIAFEHLLRELTALIGGHGN